MSKVIDGLAAAERQRRLYAVDKPPIHRRLQGFHDGAGRLETATRSWPTFTPRPAALDEALNLVEGLRRELLALRVELAALQPGGRADGS